MIVGLPTKPPRMPNGRIVGLSTIVPGARPVGLPSTSTAIASSAAKPGERRPRNRRLRTASTRMCTPKWAR
eukprot:4664320-Heterocapsa_arctica.AAC.1